MNHIKNDLIDIYISMAGEDNVIIFDAKYSKTYYIPVCGFDHSEFRTLIEFEYYMTSVTAEEINAIIEAIKTETLSPVCID